MLKTGPQKTPTGADAQEPDQGHPDTGDDVDTALREGADPAAAMPPAAAQEGVEAEGECDEPGDGEEQASGERELHGAAGYFVPSPALPALLMRARRVRNLG